MKKTILLIVTTLILNICIGSSTAFSVPSTQDTLGKIEDSLYGFQYNNENDTTRLDRIEQTVYGKTSGKSQAERIAKLSKDISADSIGKEIPPVEDTFAENQDYIIEEEPVATSDVSYPAVDEMEKQVFKQSYPNQDIKTRLSNLETKAFNKTYTDDLSTRVERLRAEIKPPTLMDNQIAQSSNEFYDDYVEPMQSDFHLNKFMPQNNFDYEAYNDMNSRRALDYDDNSFSSPKKISLSTIEKKLLRQNFADDSTENRLARIENYMFGTQFSGDDTQTRLDRITSAYQAQKSSSKYDSNRFAQNMTMAMQIGTLILMVLACIL